MKKQLAILLGSVAAVALTLTGCAYGSAGNPTELTGTWNASRSEVDNNDANALVGAHAGSWTKTNNIIEVDGVNGIVTVTTTTGGTTTTDKTYKSTLAVTAVSTITVGTDGSVTETTATTYSVADRDAAPTLVSGTTVAGVTYYGSYLAAQKAASYTETVTDTYTVVANADGKTYTEKKVSTTAYTNITGAATSGTWVDSTSTTFSYNVGKDYIEANSVSHSGYTATAATSNEGSTDNDKTVTTYALVVKDDGSYTYTTTATRTVTAPTASVGTSTSTIVETGTLLGTEIDGSKVVTFSKTSTSYTVVGTGALISTYFPSTSTTYTDDSTSSYSANYYLQGSKLVLQGQIVFTKASS